MANPLSVGDRVPDATLLRGPGEPVRVADLLRDKTSVLLFYIFDFAPP